MGEAGSTRADGQEGPRWAVGQRCPCCRYSHIVTFNQEPSDDGIFAYRCPINGGTVRFRGHDASIVSPDERDIRGSTPGRRIG